MSGTDEGGFLIPLGILFVVGQYDLSHALSTPVFTPFHRYGLVPNGGRVYYTRRSQPPLLSQMVDLYYNATGDTAFLERMLPSLVKEYEFWVENRTVAVQAFTLNQYAAPTDEPR